jgi:hypothetical protein
MTVEPAALPPVRRLSIASLLSFICGLLGCVPFVTGILAVLLGIVGLVMTSNPLKKGRWMAVVGLLLGILSVGGWTVFGGAAGGIWAIFKATEGPRVATHDFIKACADDDLAAAKALAPRIDEEEVVKIGEYVRAQGKFMDTTFNNTSLKNSTATVEGTVTFTSGKQNVTATLELSGTVWKIVGIRIWP